MSQENNLNLNIGEILNKIKEVSPEEVKNNNLYGIPGNRILIYKDIILALENNSDDEQITSKFFSLAHDIYANNAVIEWLDVEIIMGFVDKILEKADNKNPEDQHWSNIITCSFNSLGRSTFTCKGTGKIPQNINIKQIIDLADKVLKCGNVTHTAVPTAVDNVFALIFNVTSSNIKIDSQNMSDIITLIYHVVNDKGIKWNNFSIKYMIPVLACLVDNANLNLEKSQVGSVANDIVKVLDKLTDKLKPDMPSLTNVIGDILELFSYMLTIKKNPANLSPEESMKLIGQLLRKINGLNPSGNEIKNLRSIASYVSNIVCYYSQNLENMQIITGCGFNIDKENGQIQSLDTDKLKTFAGEFMADQIDHYVYRIRKSKIYQEIMSMISVENPNDIDDGPLTGLISNFRDELKRYCMYENMELEDVVAVINLLDKFLECHLEKSDIIGSIFSGLCDVVSEIPPKNEKLTEQEQNQIKAVIGFVEKVLRSDERATMLDYRLDCLVVLDFLLCNNVIGTEYYEKVAGFLKDAITIANDEVKSLFSPLLVGIISRMWRIMIDKNKNLTETYGNDIVNFIKRVANTEFPSDNPLEDYQLQDALYLMLGILIAKPELLQEKEGLELVELLLNKPMHANENPEIANTRKMQLANAVLYIIILYCNQNIEIIEKFGFRMVNGKIRVLDPKKLEEFAGENMANAISQCLIAEDKSKGQNEENNLNDNNKKIINTEMPKKQDNDNLNRKPEGQITNIKVPINNNLTLNQYNDVNGLLTASNLSTESINKLLKNVKVSFWDKFKRFFSWLWFMICNGKMVSLGTYTRTVEYYLKKQNQIQDDSKEITSLGNKIRDALDKNAHNQVDPEVEEGDQKEKEQK